MSHALLRIYTCTFFVSCTVAVDVAVAVAVAVTIVPRRVQQPPPLRYIKRYFQTLRRACTAHMTYAQGPLTPRMKCQLDACSSFPFTWVMDINRMPLSRYVRSTWRSDITDGLRHWCVPSCRSATGCPAAGGAVAPPLAYKSGSAAETEVAR